MKKLKKLEHLNEPQLRELMTALGNQIKVVSAVFEVEPPLFALILFNDPKIGQYICNCERSDAISALRETADRLERNQDIPR